MARRKDGTDFPVETQLQLVQDEGGSSLFVAVVRNVTKRKIAEKELRRQKNLMWQVIDTDPNLIFVKDVQGRFLLANQAIADFYGVTIKDMIGKRNDQVNANPQEVEKFLEADHEVIKSRHKLVLNESVTRDGRQLWLHTVKRPLLQEDGTVNVLGIGVDITELKLSESRLAESYKELQRLALYLENVRAEERAQIARNLHDEMGATLAALKMRIAWLASKLPEGMPHLSAEVGHISDLVSAGIQTVRQVVTDLRPNLLDDIGLEAAVRDHVKRFQHDTQIECKLGLPEGEVKLNEGQSVTIFRIIQESLSNVAKHARANEVDIRFGQDGDSLLLRIKDNGIGFDPDRKHQSFGLLGIKERALMIGGAATITSAPGEGTLVSLSIPCNTQSARLA
jgi:PAS domain S-box-containing protein